MSTVPGDTRLAKRQEYLAIPAELEHLLTPAVCRLIIGHPDIAIRVHTNAVWRRKHPRAETRQQPAGGVEFEDRRQAAASAGISAASLGYPYVAPTVHGYGAGRSPCPASRKLCPVFDGPIGIGLGIWLGRWRYR